MMMTTRMNSWVLVAALFAGVVHAQDPACTVAQQGVDDITTKVCAEPDLTALCARLKTALLDDDFDGTGTGTFTLFAPTDAAWTDASPIGDDPGFEVLSELTNILLYHASPNDAALTCGTVRDSLLSLNGVLYATQTRCSNGLILGQLGNVPVPKSTLDPLQNFPRRIEEISACNGRIVKIDALLGYGPQIYDYGPGSATQAPCSFHSKSCKGAKGSRRNPVPPLAVNGNVLNQIAFQNVFLRPNNNNYYSGKGSKGAWNWQRPIVNTPNGLTDRWRLFYRGGKGGKAVGPGSLFFNGYYGGYYGKGAKGFRRPFWRNLEDEEAAAAAAAINGEGPPRKLRGRGADAMEEMIYHDQQGEVNSPYEATRYEEAGAVPSKRGQRRRRAAANSFEEFESITEAFYDEPRRKA